MMSRKLTPISFLARAISKRRRVAGLGLFEVADHAIERLQRVLPAVDLAARAGRRAAAPVLAGRRLPPPRHPPRRPPAPATRSAGLA